MIQRSYLRGGPGKLILHVFFIVGIQFFQRSNLIAAICVSGGHVGYPFLKCG